jgi:glycosyltransferase involved in cell wall biosynthesis
MKPKFSIITTCMGRLDHLKLTLPRLMEQADSEVIVVDYSCPQKTGDYVAENFPAAKVVRVEGKKVFSNWAARNAGAQAAEGALLLFCDADTLLRSDATEWLAEHLPPGAYGHFNLPSTAKFNQARLRLGNNQLRGFQVIPRGIFKKFGGYDDVVVGYAAGADTDLELRLSLFRVKRMLLDPAIVEKVIEHDNEERFRNHRTPIRTSYAAGLLYRRAKTALIRFRRRPNLPRPLRQRLYAAAFKAAQNLSKDNPVTKLRFEIDKEVVGMPLQLGFREAKAAVTLEISLSGKGVVDEVPVLA